MSQSGKYKCIKGCNVYCCVGFFDICRGISHTIIKRLHHFNNIKWIFTQMTHHMYPSLGEIIQEYIVRNTRKLIS